MKKLIVSVLTALFALSVASNEASAQHWGPSGYGNSFGGFNESAGALQKGWRGIVEMGHGFSLETDLGYSNVYSISGGYQFNPHVYLGMATGIGGYDYFDVPSFKLVADARFYFLKGKVTPYFGTQFGLGVYDGACVYVSGALGVRFALKNKFGLTLSFSPAYVAWEDCEMLFNVGFEF